MTLVDVLPILVEQKFPMSVRPPHEGSHRLVLPHTLDPSPDSRRMVWYTGSSTDTNRVPWWFLCDLLVHRLNEPVKRTWSETVTDELTIEVSWIVQFTTLTVRRT